MFLEEAVRAAREETRRRKEKVPTRRLEAMLPGALPSRDFASAISRRGGRIRLIAEVKRRSPSAGTIREGASAANMASVYCEAGASAISVLTCEYRFGGNTGDLADACRVSTLPVMRKDFVTEPYQVLEARVLGASSVLLIAGALGGSGTRKLMSACLEMGMTPLVEVHGRGDLEAALEAGAEVLGINNRDLVTLEVDLRTTERLISLVPGGTVVVSESGISKREQVVAMEELGVDAILVGETLMRDGDPGRKISELLGEVDGPCGSRSVE